MDVTCLLFRMCMIGVHLSHLLLEVETLPEQRTSLRVSGVVPVPLQGRIYDPTVWSMRLMPGNDGHKSQPCAKASVDTLCMLTSQPTYMCMTVRLHQISSKRTRNCSLDHSSQSPTLLHQRYKHVNLGCNTGSILKEVRTHDSSLHGVKNLLVFDSCYTACLQHVIRLCMLASCLALVLHTYVMSQPANRGL